MGLPTLAVFTIHLSKRRIFKNGKKRSYYFLKTYDRTIFLSMTVKSSPFNKSTGHQKRLIGQFSFIRL